MHRNFRKQITALNSFYGISLHIHTTCAQRFNVTNSHLSIKAITAKQFEHKISMHNACMFVCACSIHKNYQQIILHKIQNLYNVKLRHFKTRIFKVNQLKFSYFQKRTEHSIFIRFVF